MSITSWNGRLSDLVPHREPVLVLDALVRCRRTEAVGVATFSPGDFGTERGKVCRWILIEGLAQTVAAMEGFRARREGREVPGGMLVGIREFRFFATPRCEEPVRLTTRTERAFGRLRLVTGRAEQGGVLLAEGTLKLYVEETDGENRAGAS